MNFLINVSPQAPVTSQMSYLQYENTARLWSGLFENETIRPPMPLAFLRIDHAEDVSTFFNLDLFFADFSTRKLIDLSSTPTKQQILSDDVEAALHSFAEGIDEIVPSKQTVEYARLAAIAAVQFTSNSEITIEEDGTLSFVFRLNDKRGVMAEFCAEGYVHVGVFGPDNSLESHDTEAPKRFIERIKS